MADEESDSTPKLPKWRRAKRAMKWIIGIPFGAILVYLLIALVGLIPVNNSFQPSDDGVEIFVVSNAVHADIVVPIKTEQMDWSAYFPADHFSGPIDAATHVAIGWGDKGFFLETPTWADLKASVAANALLLPSSSCVHVRMTNAQFIPAPANSVKISSEQYERLVKYVLETLQQDANKKPIVVADQAYGSSDAFYEANGSYHIFNTCNCWVGGGLKEAGVRTGWLTPLPKTVYMYFPE